MLDRFFVGDSSMGSANMKSSDVSIFIGVFFMMLLLFIEVLSDVVFLIDEIILLLVLTENVWGIPLGFGPGLLRRIGSCMLGEV